MKKILYSFSLLELIIVIGLIAVLTTAAILLFNPLNQIHKSQDGRRKNDLSQMQKVFEDFYNDNNRYPKANEVCYQPASASRIDSTGRTACTCPICGQHSDSPKLEPYLSQLPCDPRYPSADYLYDFDCSSENPGWYRIYTNLAVDTDPLIEEVGCQSGCGPRGGIKYNYGVSSPNVDLELYSYNTCPPTNLKCLQAGGDCNACGDLENCQSSGCLGPPYYTDVGCTVPCMPP